MKLELGQPGLFFAEVIKEFCGDNREVERFYINECRAPPCGPALKDPSKLMVDFRCLSYL